jgi:SAM-dependent methyltransferase
MPLNSQQSHEIGFWRGLVEHHGAGYRAFRIAEYRDKTQRFEPWWSAEDGCGIDVGCGCVSVLEGSDKAVQACDALVDEYEKFFPLNIPEQIYLQMDAENLKYPDGSIDFVFCVNMLDHTPNPAKAVAEMHRVLKTGGRLYFEVNFDDDEAPAHYGKWTMTNVYNMFGCPAMAYNKIEHNMSSVEWRCLMYTVERHDAGNQWRYWSILEKR